MPRQNESVNEIGSATRVDSPITTGESAERLSKPLVRREGKLGRASWETATRLAGAALAKARSNLLVLASGRLSNEDLFNLKALADQAGAKRYCIRAWGEGT